MPSHLGVSDMGRGGKAQYVSVTVGCDCDDQGARRGALEKCFLQLEKGRNA